VAHGTVTGECLRFLLFALLGLLGPAIGLFRLLRLRVDPALLLPLALVQSGFVHFLSLRLSSPWLFLLIEGVLDLLALAPPFDWKRAPGASLKGAIPAFLACVLLIGFTEFRQNRVGPRGDFVFDNVVPEDSAFHVGLAWELSVSYPPDVPGLSGVPMGYHLGLPLVRAAETRWAGLHPYDIMSRFEVLLTALGLVLVLREAARHLGASSFGIGLVGWSLVATDFSFVYWKNASVDFWINATDSNLLFSLVHANSSVAAIIVAVAACLALARYDAGEGRGFLVLAALFGAAVPHFKVFVAAQFLFGLGLGALLTRRLRPALYMGVPAAIGLLFLVSGAGGANMEVRLDPLLIVQKCRESLGLGPAHGAWLVWSTLLWLATSLGLRVLGLPGAVRALFSGRLPAGVLAGMALFGWPAGMLFRVTPLVFPGRAPYNEAWYFIEQSAPFLWLFAAVFVSSLKAPRPLVVLILAALSLPSTLQFAWAKHATPSVHAPPSVVEGMSALAQVTRPGEVVLERPEPKRYPPPPMVLIGRRVPYARFIPYLYQVAPQAELQARLAAIRTFFKTEDPKEAVRVARSLGARYVCLYGEDQVAFPKEGVLKALYERDSTRVYEIVGNASP
jgi:hypothetical protein